MLGSPMACRISRERFLTSSRWAISVRLAASIEMGNAAAWTSRVPPGPPTRTVDLLVVRPTARRQARRKLAASARRWNPSKSAPSSPSTTCRRHGSWAKIS